MTPFDMFKAPRAGDASRRARTTRRRVVSRIAVTLCALSVLVALIPLALILFFVVSQGVHALNWDFFTQLPRPVGETGGGMANAIAGTLMLIRGGGGDEPEEF